MGVHNLADAHLADLDAASQARTRIAVEHGAIPDSLPTRLEEGILLGVYAQTGGEPDARTVPLVAAGAPSVGAVADAPRRAIVAGADDTALPPDEDAPDTTLHAVGALGRQRRQGHKVRVPAGAEAVGVGDVELAQRGIQVGERRRRVEQPDRGAGDEGLEAAVGVV